MSGKQKHITIFEHQTLRVGDCFNDNQTIFDEQALEAFRRHYGEKGVPYYTLVNKGIRFNQYVGVIQVGKTVIEVLPKIDKADEESESEKKWRNILIKMLLAVGPFHVKSTGSSSLHVKPTRLLDLYFELFLHETEYLLHRGLLKKYRSVEANATNLKGSIRMDKHIQKNLTHAERFYVRFTAYDTRHLLNSILYKTIRLLQQINTNARLQNRISSLLLYFPEMPSIKVTDEMFGRIVYNRSTLPYKNAIQIAQLLLLNYHPDIRHGRINVLALMFDMNKLWEEFIYVSLKKNIQPGESVRKQVIRNFWQSNNGDITTIRPDILLTTSNESHIIIDAKWKIPVNNKPNSEDLRQMYVYHQYYQANQVALVYPGREKECVQGIYLPTKGNSLEEPRRECFVVTLTIENNTICEWQKSIYTSFTELLRDQSVIQ